MNYSESCQQMGHAILSKASEPMAKRMDEAISFMVENAKDANWEALHRSMKILEGLEEPREHPYTGRFWQLINKRMEEQYRLDLIYYSLCYDGFRV